MPSRGLAAGRLRWPAREPSLPVYGAPCPERVPTLRPVPACISAPRRSYVGLLIGARRAGDLHQRRRPMRRGLVEQVERMFVLVGRKRAAHHAPETFERPEPIHHRARLITATYHAVSALGIA